MADKTGIEWTDATWNPTVGCKVVSPGCTNCYAMKVAARMEGISVAHEAAHGGNPGPMYYYRDLVTHSKAGPVWNGTFREAPLDLLYRPLRWKRPRRIFVNSMSDLFGEGVTDETIDKVFAVMALCPQHTFQILTKRPERMRDYMVRIMESDFGSEDVALAAGRMMEDSDNAHDCVLNQTWPLPNVWLGVSVEDQKRADERIPILLKTPAAVRWISAEPLLGPVDISEHLFGRAVPCGNCPKDADCDCGYSLRSVLSGEAALDWVVVGGESGPGARPMHPDWARSLRDQCKAAGVAFLFKQWGNWGPETTHPGSHEAGVLTAMTTVASTDKKRIGDRTWLAGSGPDRPSTILRDVGKKRAGRLLDGVEHNEYPEAR